MGLVTIKHSFGYPSKMEKTGLCGVPGILEESVAGLGDFSCKGYTGFCNGI